MLHQVVREHLETFLAEARLRGGGEGLPRFVERELRESLTCGVLAQGFARFRCADCVAGTTPADSAAGAAVAAALTGLLAAAPAAAGAAARAAPSCARRTASFRAWASGAKTPW